MTSADSSGVQNIEPVELKARLDRGEKIRLLDVREEFEWDIVNLEPEGAVLVPMSQLPQRIDELDPEEEIVVYCHSGRRSLVVAHQLHASGFRKVLNLRGGIGAWAADVDPSLPTY